MKRPLAYSIALITTLICLFLILYINLRPNITTDSPNDPSISPAETSSDEQTEVIVPEQDTTTTTTPSPSPSAQDPDSSSAYDSTNCTTSWGELMLINPNFTVTTSWIATRRHQLIDLTATYGIKEGNSANGTPMLDEVAASHLFDMLTDYSQAFPGHELSTRSCFRAVGTNCGRLCYATGTSDHHTGYTCDLIDSAYGNILDTNLSDNHPEWQWLHNNSYKYGFIDRFVPEWSGGPMTAPVNVDANGSTGLYETWHFRYVGITAATAIATGKYNNGQYDSLEHYLKSAGYLSDLLSPSSCLR